ncbi:hypothetical protein M3Y99_00137500 [Aphelenchoides fujianensis]|nr:hypothetical protein M3Y99_00137500 [Aphelenchoides fujianensis]
MFRSLRFASSSHFPSASFCRQFARGRSGVSIPPTEICASNRWFSSSRLGRMLVAPAVERNKQPILEVLELASGTGGHVIHFAQHFTRATFQPSEVNPRSLHSIVAHVDHYRPENVRIPLHIDCTRSPDRWALPGDYGPASVDLILNINMIHISSNAAVSGLFKAANGLLKSGGRLITYGPYGIDGRITPESNVSFDQNLRAENPEWGLRQVDELVDEAKRNGLRFVAKHAMPANNHVLVFEKPDES